MTDALLLIDEPALHVRRLTLNRPEARNALSSPLLVAVAEALEAASDDANIRAIVLTGGAKVFAAGADIKELATRDTVTGLLDARTALWGRIRRFAKPMVAAIDGYALGGGLELAMHADIAVAGPTAQFGLPEINLGFIPGGGGTQRLARIAGQQLAMKLILTGEFADAKTAHAAGLVAEIADDAQLRAVEIAAKIAQKAPLAARLAKELVLAARDTPLETGLAFERKAIAALWGTDDFKEGVGAFLEKRKATFAGK